VTFLLNCAVYKYTYLLLSVLTGRRSVGLASERMCDMYNRSATITSSSFLESGYSWSELNENCLMLLPESWISMYLMY